MEGDMPRYLIERDIPGAGSFTDDEINAVCKKSNDVLTSLAPRVQWVHSYVTDDQIVCVYIADDEDVVREHARLGGFPANRVQRVRRVIDPVTYEAEVALA
jgi:hypothetical protein